MLDANKQTSFAQLQAQEAKTILIVDDEAIIRDLCARALKDYQVLEAKNGEEALKFFERGGIDVILTDIMMPKLNGIELLKRVKELDPTLVVIVMTGYAEKEVILNALKEDADDFIPKPLNLLQLKTSVQKALEKKALKEEVANLKSLDRLKTNFLSIISHKFRTPITTISLFLQNLAGGVYDPAEPLFNDNLRLIHAESCYLAQLVSDLLVFTQVMDTGGSLKQEPCDLQNIIAMLVAESAEAARKPRVSKQLELEAIPPMLLDRPKISFAIKQILDNAFKFSAEVGTVVISLKAMDNETVLVVRDSGIGIAKKDQAKIFEKFYQVDLQQTGQIRGFGLGLFYAREFIKLHGGSIAIKSEPGQGTEVTITLPLANS